MKARVIGAVAAIILAVVGTMLVASYVSGSDARALQGVNAVSVYVVKERVLSGTPSDKLGSSVESELVPAKVAAADAVTNLDTIKGKVATVDLMPGEQLLASRFADPASLRKEAGGVAVPAGMQEVTIPLAPERVVGGQVNPGDTVGIVISLDGAGGGGGQVTHLELQKVLVTNVQSGKPASSDSSTGATPPPKTSLPSGTIFVTFARKAPDVEKIVFAAEFGKIWLTKEPASADTNGTRKVTKDEVYG